MSPVTQVCLASFVAGSENEPSWTSGASATIPGIALAKMSVPSALPVATCWYDSVAATPVEFGSKQPALLICRYSSIPFLSAEFQIESPLNFCLPDSICCGQDGSCE